MNNDYADYDTTMPSDLFPEGGDSPRSATSKFRVILVVLICSFAAALALFLI
jgi:hypothetical protein